MNDFPTNEQENEDRVHARIVAWVLGEASAFEAAELESLCEKNAELGAFAEEIRNIHGLLEEAASSGDGQDWKLSGEKRKALEPMLGEPPEEVERERRIAISKRRVWMMAACVAFTAVAVFLLRQWHGDSMELGMAPALSDYVMAPPGAESVDLETLRREYREMEEQVEERRKMLSTITRTKGINYAGESDESSDPLIASYMFKGPNLVDERLARADVVRQDKREDASFSEVAPQDFADAKQAYERDLAKLGEMKVALIAEGLAMKIPDSGWSEPAAVAKDEASSSQPGLAGSEQARREMVRRQQTVTDADRLLLQGREAYAKGDFQQAVDKYREAIDGLPDAPLLSDRRQSYTDHLADASVALAQQHRKVGKYTEARSLLESVLSPDVDPQNATAKQELGYLDDPIRTNPALTYEHTQNVDRVRRGLYTAEGNYNLGKFDDAKEEYENVLRVDPFNSAARRGLERVASAKTDYYRAAYDHTRAELLMQVDKAWELSVPGASAEAKSDYYRAAYDHTRAELLTQVDEASELPALAASPLPAEAPAQALAAVEAENPADPFASARIPRARTALPAPVELEEVRAAEEPVSTFSLNVGDASFRLAKAAIEAGGRPDPSGVRVEQFYNAVDYGDPAPASDEPVAARIEQAADPVIPGRQLLRVGLRTAVEGRAASQPLRLTLLVDQSGSMGREDRREALATAVEGLAALLGAEDRVTVIGFARTPRLLAEGLSGAETVKLPGLVVAAALDEGTNFEEALNLARELALRHRMEGAQNRIILFTDGAANLGDADPLSLSGKIVELRQQGIAFDIAGMGTDELNDRLLGEMARHGNGRYLVVDEASAGDFARRVGGAFRPAAENVKVQVRFNPERVGGYRLVGFAEDRLREEDFRNDAVDAAELAAGEAGSALYQVEVLPGGEGEIGEVSVRFRDTASGRMVERSWMIGYDPASPAFDRASPAMQLAGLAMLAGEKLRGGALADAIDFAELRAPRAEARRVFGKDGRVLELLEMIGKLE